MSVTQLEPRPARDTSRPPAPNRLLTSTEPGRACMELGSLMAAAPILLAAPRGDGQPVLVLPGLSGGSGWTAWMRMYLRSIGHSVHSPRFAGMKGRPTRVRRLLADRVDELADRHGGPVSLVGWSVGGCFARQVAAADPRNVKQVVTLGTPLDGMWYSEDQRHAAGLLQVPVTAIVSRTDGVFAWRRCVQRTSRRSENVEVPSSHLGMATNPFSYHVLADRLAQPAGTWRPYVAPLHLDRLAAGEMRRP
jgi:pimeloyl-ACP methyl ester carboxylesterase